MPSRSIGSPESIASGGSLRPMSATERKLTSDLIELREEHRKVKEALEAVQKEVRTQLQQHHHEIKTEVQKSFDDLTRFLNTSHAAQAPAAAASTSTDVVAVRPTSQEDFAAVKAKVETLEDFAAVKAKVETLEERVSDNASQFAKLRSIVSQQEERVQVWVNEMREAMNVKIADIHSQVITARQMILREVNHFSVVSALDTSRPGGSGSFSLRREDTLEVTAAEHAKMAKRYEERLEHEVAKVRWEVREAAETRKQAPSSATNATKAENNSTVV